LRATALWAAKLGWKLTCVIHDDEPVIYEGNLKIVKLSGAELRFVQKTEVKDAMDKAMVDLSNEGYKPFYIWGGGHCVEGALAYYEAVKELKEQLKGVKPDFLFVASGTGTTQAGIEIGVRQFLPGCKVIGISVARDEQRGKEAVLESMGTLNNYLGNPITMPDNIEFDDNWMGCGYEATYPELIDTIKWAAKTEGLILDPTYTGKAFHALRMYVKNEVIKPNSNVVFWHTGGLLNLMATNKI
jgi:D-cysteine desulfhydrase